MGIGVEGINIRGVERVLVIAESLRHFFDFHDFGWWPEVLVTWGVRAITLY